MQEEDDDGTSLQGTWVRKHGYVSEFDIDARWILYFPDDERPQGSLRIVSHPDLPPGHLKSFVSIVTKRWPKTPQELSRTLENYGLLENNELSFFNDIFYRSKVATTYYSYQNVIYQNKKYRKEGNKTLISYHDPISETEIMKNNITQRTNIIGDEFSVVSYSDPISTDEIRNMVKSMSNELDSYNINEHIQTWDTETMDKMKTLEKLYNVKIFN